MAYEEALARLELGAALPRGSLDRRIELSRAEDMLASMQCPVDLARLRALGG